MATQEQHEDAVDAFVLERALFQESGVWFYQVPRGQVTTMAPRADSWDPEHPFMTGSLRVLQRGDACFVQLFEPSKDAETDTTTDTLAPLFAQCPLVISRDEPLDQYVQDCVDSSRYFMLRVEDERTQRRAFVGVGFPERASAFHFKATLQDYAKYALRQLEVGQTPAVAEEGAEAADSAPSPQRTSDLSLPEGTTIRINLKPLGTEDSEKPIRQSSSSTDAASPAKVPLIPPPPSAAPAAVPAIAPPPSAESEAIDDDDWGDFTSA